jgi:hypothetical protein
MDAKHPTKSGVSASDLDARTATELEAAVFRRLLRQFDELKVVQNF